MKAVVLAGGLGTRISEETESKPKPMVEIGGMPILWHILKLYSHHGINDFIICCGYKGYVLKEYFSNYFLHMSDVTFDIQKNTMKVHHNFVDPWKITLVDTGLNTMTGGRLKRIYEYVKNEKAFCMTYGDGLGDVNITELIKFHENHGKKVTITAVNPPGRFGAIEIGHDQKVTSFKEKPKGEMGLINGGFFVLSPNALNLIKNDSTIWEGEPLESLAAQSELMAYRHHGFWQPMDTLRDKITLEKLWSNGDAPWKIW